MIRRRITSLLAAATVAVSLSFAGASPASAKPSTDASIMYLGVQGCLDNYGSYLWQYNSLGSNKHMSSCYANDGFTAVTRIWSSSFWTGFHGCATLQFYHGTTLVHESTTQRWGVSADRSRTLTWTGSMPTTYWDNKRFKHWRC